MKIEKQTVALVLFAIGLVACSSFKTRDNSLQLTDTGTPVLHSIDSAELRILMGRMNSLMFERNLTELDLDKQRRHTLSKVQDAAGGVNNAIDGILAVMPNLNLAAGEQKLFSALAVKLRNESLSLKQQAQLQQVEAIPDTLEKMEATCTACHELFRDLSKNRGQP